jgi:hypothetical protein
LNINVIEEQVAAEEIITGAFIGAKEKGNLTTLIIITFVILISILILFMRRKTKSTLNEDIVINDSKDN